jgi:hypothetical protein
MSGDSERFTASAGSVKRHGLRPGQRGIEVRYETIPGRELCPCGCGQRAIDEIFAVGLHAEMMDEDACWMDVGGLRVWMQAYRVPGQRKLRLVVTAQPDTCTEEPR